MTSKRTVVLAALCGLALVAAGCGDDDNDTLSYDDTGTEIGEICQGVEAQAQGLNGKPANDAPILADFAEALEEAVQEVRDLDVDEELAETRDAFADNGAQQVAVIREAQALAEDGDAKAYRAKVEEDAAPLGRESDELASKLGATGCISDGE
jgi:hypothetical protein